MTLQIETNRGIAAQILRHRSFTFQEFSQRYADSSQLGNIPLPELRRQDFKNRQNSIPDLPDELKKRFNENYGSYNKILFEYFKKLPNGGEKICKNLFEFEVAYLMEQEMATTTEDILFRRTKLGIDFPKDKLFLLDEIIKKYSKENSVR